MSPKAILFDLDDTILSAYGNPGAAWLAVADEMAAALSPLSPIEVTDAITAYAVDFWADPDHHRSWRLKLAAARRAIVTGAFAALQASGRPTPDMAIAERLADRYTAYRDERMHLFPDAHVVIDTLKARGLRLALVTNGAAEVQRAKIDRFDLAHRFDHIQIEGEVGFGKPEEQAYLHAMQALDVTASETWMVGDNLEWEVAAPQRLGIYAIWHDALGQGLPSHSPIRPDRIIRTLAELL